MAMVQYVLPYRNEHLTQMRHALICEIAFTALAATSLVEAAVHTIVFIPYIIASGVAFAIYRTIPEALYYPTLLFAVGIHVSVQNTFNCLAALFLNLYRYNALLSYDELLPCVDACHQTLIPGFPALDLFEDLRVQRREADTRFQNTCIEAINAITPDQLRGGLPGKYSSGFSTMKIHIKFGDSPEIFRCGQLVSTEAEMNTHLPGLKQYAIEQLQQKFVPPNFLATNHLAIALQYIPESIEISYWMACNDAETCALYTTTISRYDGRPQRAYCGGARIPQDA
jgi:hypothetical protein